MYPEICLGIAVLENLNRNVLEMFKVAMIHCVAMSFSSFYYCVSIKMVPFKYFFLPFLVWNTIIFLNKGKTLGSYFGHL